MGADGTKVRLPWTEPWIYWTPRPDAGQGASGWNAFEASIPAGEGLPAEACGAVLQYALSLVVTMASLARPITQCDSNATMESVQRERSLQPAARSGL